MDQIWHCLLWTSSHQWGNYKDRRILTEVRQVTQLLCIKAKLSSPLCVWLLFVLVVVWWWCNEALENGFRFVVNTTTVLKHLEIWPESGLFSWEKVMINCSNCLPVVWEAPLGYPSDIIGACRVARRLTGSRVKFRSEFSIVKRVQIEG